MVIKTSVNSQDAYRYAQFLHDAEDCLLPILVGKLQTGLSVKVIVSELLGLGSAYSYICHELSGFINVAYNFIFYLYYL